MHLPLLECFGFSVGADWKGNRCRTSRDDNIVVPGFVRGEHVGKICELGCINTELQPSPPKIAIYA